MAKVELDISEYEALKENQRLLKEAKEEQQKLQDRLTQAYQEKIDILSENAHLVTIQTLSEIREYKVLTVIPDLWNAFMSTLTRDKPRFTDYYQQENYVKSLFTKLIEGLATNKSVTTNKIVSYKGFDDVKEKLREELK